MVHEITGTELFISSLAAIGSITVASGIVELIAKMLGGNGVNSVNKIVLPTELNEIVEISFRSDMRCSTCSGYVKHDNRIYAKVYVARKYVMNLNAGWFASKYVSVYTCEKCLEHFKNLNELAIKSKSSERVFPIAKYNMPYEPIIIGTKKE